LEILRRYIGVTQAGLFLVQRFERSFGVGFAFPLERYRFLVVVTCAWEILRGFGGFAVGHQAGFLLLERGQILNFLLGDRSQCAVKVGQLRIFLDRVVQMAIIRKIFRFEL
jgi:hypothetical protein